MRLKMITFFLLLLLSAGVSLAQGWINYIDRAERFIVNFPGEPEIQDTSYVSQFNATCLDAFDAVTDRCALHFAPPSFSAIEFVTGACRSAAWRAAQC